MGSYSYLQQYGVGDERRHRVLLAIILSCVGALILFWVLYLLLHNYSEKQTVKHFLAEINQKDYKQAYSDWGCTDKTPCPNYDYSRFLEDWGPAKKTTSLWTIASIDGCKSFVTVNVKADGSELQSLGVERGSHSLMFAPAPECQEPKWHWKQFFQRIFGGGKT